MVETTSEWSTDICSTLYQLVQDVFLHSIKGGKASEILHKRISFGASYPHHRCIIHGSYGLWSCSPDHWNDKRMKRGICCFLLEIPQQLEKTSDIWHSHLSQLNSGLFVWILPRKLIYSRTRKSPILKRKSIWNHEPYLHFGVQKMLVFGGVPCMDFDMLLRRRHVALVFPGIRGTMMSHRQGVPAAGWLVSRVGSCWPWISWIVNLTSPPDLPPK